ncbi:Beta-1,4-mannooligosaccharide phosphorylase [subsurface metagenome]
MEDSRITKIKDEYFITFTEFKGKGKKTNITRIGLVKTKDFKTYYGRKIILDEYGNNKNCVIFNDKESDKFYVIHRPFNEDRYLTPPGIRIAKTKDFLDFENLGILLSPRPKMWDSARVGINTSPIEIKNKKFGNALFMLYHGANEARTYSMGYVLVKKDDPTKILERSENPLLKPELEWEKGIGKYSAEKPDVSFCCGAIPISKNRIRGFYAGADMYTGFVDLTLKDAEVKNYSTD